MNTECCEARPNFGRRNCVQLFEVIVGAILVPKKDGDPNYWAFDLDGITSDVILPSFYAQEPVDRLYKLPEFVTVTTEKAETLFDEAPSGKKSFIRKGKRSFTCEVWDKDATSGMLKKLEKVRCGGWDIYLVTSDNYIIGSTKVINNNITGTKTVFSPIPLDEQSFDSMFMFKTDEATQKITITFDLDRTFKDEDLYAISGNEMWNATESRVDYVDFINPIQIIDASATNVVSTTTSIAFDLNDDFRQGAVIADFNGLGNVTGLGITNFSVFNKTTGLPVAITSVGENPDGSYLIVIPAQTSNDVLEVFTVLSESQVYNASFETKIP